jgi:DNA-binding MarR family transcriptional regulator
VLVPDSRRAVRPKTTLLYLVKQVELAVRSRLDDLLRPSGLTVVQYTALTVLQRHPASLTSAQLARNSFVTAQTMADMVSALLDRGLIERQRDPADRRRLVLALTPDGEALLGRFVEAVEALEAQMLSGLTAAQATELGASLLSCRAALETYPLSPSPRGVTGNL